MTRPVVEEVETMEGIPVGGAAGGLLICDESVTEGGTSGRDGREGWHRRGR